MSIALAALVDPKQIALNLRAKSQEEAIRVVERASGMVLVYE